MTHHDDALLRRAGISVVTSDGAPLAHAECIRIARRLRAAGAHVVGFVPATDRVAVPAVAIQIGAALVELSGATVAYVDANVRYPALSAIADEGADSADSVFSTRWLHGSLALLTPPHAERAGDVMPQLVRLLEEGSSLFQHVLVDLTGFDLLGEHAGAAATLDGIAVVAEADATREGELLAASEWVPERRLLGVILIG